MFRSTVTFALAFLAASGANAQMPPPGELNRDAKSDLIFRNQNTGENLAWYMDGATRLAEVSLPLYGEPLFVIVGTGDFDGDGDTGDILFRSSFTGVLTMWLMEGAVATTQATLPLFQPDARTARVAGIGDLDGDGKSDIVFTQMRDNALQPVVWFMNGTAVSSSADLMRPGEVIPLAAVEDVSGDGKADLIFRASGLGACHVCAKIGVWLMNGATVTAAQWLPDVADPWTLFGAGDFDGDGKGDLFWRNTTTGENAVWLLDGAQLAAGHYLPSVPTGTTIQPVGFGDFNADSKCDVHWRDSNSGENAVWLMDGATLALGLHIPFGPSPSNQWVAASPD